MSIIETPLPAHPHSKVAIRLADEGIPIRAIARATKIESDELREILAEAVERGCILQVPGDDWPPGTGRETRCPSAASLASLSDELLDRYIGHVFNTTRLETSVLIPIIKRPEVSRECLHQAIEDRRPTANDQTDPKMVDVVICKLRKKLKAHDIIITTNWSRGYSMTAADRKMCADKIMAYSHRET